MDGDVEYDDEMWALAHRPVREPRTIACGRCGRSLILASAWANTCDCGAEYSVTGQRLAPRSQWGEETGESFC